MSLNENLQRQILRRLAREYPNFAEISLWYDYEDTEIQQNLFYLAEKGSLEPRSNRERPGTIRAMLEAKITARGLELIHGAKDSATSAESSPLSLELEAVRQFIAQALSRSAVPDQPKREALNRLAEFSESDLKAFLVRLIQAAAENPRTLVNVVLGREV